MKQIKLTRGMIALVDDEDFERLNEWKWYASKNGNTFYAARTSKKINGKQSVIYMHRDIMETPVGLDVDHINGNSIDNQKINLRNCTRSKNMMNVGKQKDNTSGYKGVSWFVRDKKWVAMIRFGDKRKNLGYYDTPEEAAIAYNNAVIIYHGEFAKLNSIVNGRFSRMGKIYGG